MGNCNCKQGTNGTQAVCTECDILQLARNNYFTGKLLVERDFTDEQRYVMGKLRRHDQKLHGWGTVCGLKVKQHPNPACQAQYVVIDPGTAIDCCGREILVNCQEYFDFEAKYLANWQKQNGPNSQPDTKPHKLQICVDYKECPTEKVPALFDDCAGGGGACQPNRILESHCFDVIIDGPSSSTDPSGVFLEWDFTKNIANAVKVAEDDASERLYVLTSASSATGATATLYVIDTSNYTLLTPITLANSLGMDLAISGEGDLVYVVVQPTTSGTDTATGAPQLYTYNTTSAPDTLTQVNQLPIGSSSDPSVKLAACPGTEGSVFTFGTATGVLAWSGLNTSTPTPTSTGVTPAIPSPVAMVVSTDNQYAYVASSGSNTITVVTVSTSSVTAANNITGLPAGAAPTSLAIAATTQGATLAALDTNAQTLYFVDIPTAGPSGATVVNQNVNGFAYSAMQVLLSPGGRWAYVLEQDKSSSPDPAYVQPVDEHAAELGQTVLGKAVAVGVGPLGETLSDDGSNLYVTYQNPSQPNLGGVAIVDVLQQNCVDIFKTVIDCCPDCAQGNCLVLATVEGYVYGSAVTDPTPGKPIAAGQIDNLTDRRLLVSTDVLTRAVQCILDQGAGGGAVGPQGPPGLPGQPGKDGTNGTNGSTGPMGPGIDTLKVTFVPCGAGSASLSHDPPPSTNYTLNLAIPGCCNQNLTGIQTVSWTSNGGLAPFTDFQHNGVKIAFSNTVNSTDLTTNSIVLLATSGSPSSATNFLEEIGLSITPGNFATLGNVTSSFSPASGYVNGVSFIAINPDELRQLANKTLLVIVKGDFIRDQAGNAVDGNHLPPWVPNVSHTGDGIAGGTFESWLTLET